MKKIIIFITLLIFIPFFIVIIYNKNYKEIELKYINITYIRVKKLKTNIIEKIPLEEYIVGVLAGEMPIYFEKEALKAQAVVARTYTIYKIKNGSKHENNRFQLLYNIIYQENRGAKMFTYGGILCDENINIGFFCAVKKSLHILLKQGMLI